MNEMFKFVDFAADDGGGSSDNADTTADNEGNTTLTFEAWSESLPEEHKALIESHTKSLKSALDSERGTRKELEKQMRAMAKQAEAGSEMQTQLTKLADDIQTADRKADFYEAAHSAGVKNLKLAFTVAAQDEMFDRHGRVNFDEMKKAYPELFDVKPQPRGDAGSGTGNKPKASQSMNDLIRQKAGR